MIFPTPILTTGILVCDFCGVSSVIAIVGGGVDFVVAVMVARTTPSTALAVLCLDFRFFFLLGFSPLKTNFPLPIMAGWLACLIIASCCVLVSKGYRKIEEMVLN